MVIRVARLAFNPLHGVNVAIVKMDSAQSQDYAVDLNGSDTSGDRITAVSMIVDNLGNSESVTVAYDLFTFTVPPFTRLSFSLAIGVQSVAFHLVDGSINVIFSDKGLGVPDTQDQNAASGNVGTYVRRDGTTPFDSNQAMGDGVNNFRLINMADPINDQDAATKHYVDQRFNFANLTGPNGLNFVPVQQGTGIGQSNNAVKIGWDNVSKLLLTVDNVSQGYIVTGAQLDAGVANAKSYSDNSSTSPARLTALLQGTAPQFAGGNMFYNAGGIFVNMDAPEGMNKAIVYRSAGTVRWQVGSDFNNNFFVLNFTDAGNPNENILYGVRSTGLLATSRKLRVQGIGSSPKSQWPQTDGTLPTVTDGGGTHSAYGYLDDGGLVAGGRDFFNGSNLAISTYARSSDTFGTPSEITIGVSSFVSNDKRYAGNIGQNGNGAGSGPAVCNVWNYYATAIQYAYVVSGSTVNWESDIANCGPTVQSFPSNINPNGLTVAMRVATGGEATGTLAGGGSGGASIVRVATAAFHVLSNDANATDANFNAGTQYATFDKGLVFHRFAIQGTNGYSGVGIAIAASNGHAYSWYNPANAETLTIVSNPGTDANSWAKIINDSSGFYITKGLDNTPQFKVTGVANAVNCVSVSGNIAGSAPIIQPFGTDANINLQLASKGNGTIFTSNTIAQNMTTAPTVNEGFGLYYGKATKTGGGTTYGLFFASNIFQATTVNNGADVGAGFYSTFQNIGNAGSFPFALMVAANTPSAAKGQTYTGSGVYSLGIFIGNRWADTGFQDNLGGARWHGALYIAPNVWYNADGDGTSFNGTFGIILNQSGANRWHTGILFAFDSITTVGYGINLHGGSGAATRAGKGINLSGYFGDGLDLSAGNFSDTQLKFATGQMPNAANDAAAQAAGCPLGGIYRNGSVLMTRVA